MHRMGECIVSSIELPEELFLDTIGQFLANGIVGYEGGLLIARSAGGFTTWTSMTKLSVRSWVPPIEMAIRSMVTHYINEQMGYISVYRLSFEGGLASVEYERSIRSDLYDTPSTTSTLCGDYVVSVIVSGLSDAELPEETCDTGMVHMEIEGLAMGGATSPSNKQKGHVVFVRSYGTNQLDIRRHLLYRRKVFLPFVDDIRQSLGQAPGTLDIDEALAAVIWQDEDHAQLAAVTAEVLLEE
jgi:hypothetical protein